MLRPFLVVEYAAGGVDDRVGKIGRFALWVPTYSAIRSQMVLSTGRNRVSHGTVSSKRTALASSGLPSPIATRHSTA